MDTFDAIAMEFGSYMKISEIRFNLSMDYMRHQVRISFDSRTEVLSA